MQKLAARQRERWPDGDMRPEWSQPGVLPEAAG